MSTRKKKIFVTEDERRRELISLLEQCRPDTIVEAIKLALITEEAQRLNDALGNWLGGKSDGIF